MAVITDVLQTTMRLTGIPTYTGGMAAASAATAGLAAAEGVATVATGGLTAAIGTRLKALLPGGGQ